MFLRYLLEQKVINEEMCVSAFSLAQEKNKSFFNFVVNKKCLKPAQLADLIIANLENGLTFSTSIKDYLDEKTYKDLIAEYLDSNKSIFDCIVDLNGVSFEKITSLYEDYKKSGATALTNKASVSPAPVEISAAALESLRELAGNGKIDASVFAELEIEKKVDPLKDEFLKVFSENRFKKIKKLSTLMMEEVKKNGQASNYLNSFYQELHLVQGAANMAGIQTLVKLLSSFEEKIENIMQQDESVVKEWLNLNQTALEKFIDKTWEFRLKESA